MIRSQQEEVKDGITIKVLTVCPQLSPIEPLLIMQFCLQKYVCHGSVPLGQALFRDFFKCGKNSKKSTPKPYLSKEQFVLGCQKILQLIGDEKILTFYVQVEGYFKIHLFFH